MDRRLRDPACSTARSSEIMGPPLPTIGIGEPVADVVERLEHRAAVLVLDGGHPVGVLTRSDVLSFLRSAGRRSGVETRRWVTHRT